MKKISLFMALLPVAALTACSSEEIDEPELPTNSGAPTAEIKFVPTFDRNSRAASLYDSNNIPTEFTVGAFHIDSLGNRKPFFLGDVYQKKNGQWQNTTGTRYWPDGGSTDFYALVLDSKDNNNSQVGWNEQVTQINGLHAHSLPSAYIMNYAIANDPAQQYDLLYAVRKGQRRSSAGVPLNFRHALSQVVFDAKNTSKNIYVEVSGIRLDGLNMHVGVTLPDKSTDVSAIDNDSTYADLSPLTNVAKRSYSAVTFDNVALVGDPDESAAATPLTSADPAMAMLLSPAQGKLVENTANVNQTTPQYAYVPNTSNPGSSLGSCLRVNCAIWEVSDPVKGHDASKDVELWGGKAGAHKELVIPFDVNGWKQGKRYVYTLEFGKGTAGYDPETDTPVLVPITYDVTVDNWVDVNQSKQL